MHEMINDKNSVHESTGFWISRIARFMERDFEKRLEPLDITRGAFAVLSAIHHDKKAKPAEIAAFLGVDGAAITRHLDRVEKRELIERVMSSTDRRSTDIYLTAKGRRILRRGRSFSKATNERFTANLSESETKQLQSLIRKMLSESGVAVTDI